VCIEQSVVAHWHAPGSHARHASQDDERRELDGIGYTRVKRGEEEEEEASLNPKQ